MGAYNLFRRKGDRDLYCAVPESRAVPPFVNGCAWEFGGKLDAQRPFLLGFDPRAAKTGVRFNGFYLFQAFTRH